jgi:hypothetical protein
MHHAFDLLKNKELDMTTSAVLCLILKVFLVLDKLRAKRHDKNWNCCLPLNHKTTFCNLHKLSKIPKWHFVPQTSYNTKFVKYLKGLSCADVLYCPVLLCYVHTSSPFLSNLRARPPTFLFNFHHYSILVIIMLILTILNIKLI